jgi:abhydrolase domain-containing protein 4/abhydrolase domain-containing protein 5
MTSVGPWPINPIGERMKSIDDNLPITFLYGADSWTSKAYGFIIQEHRSAKNCYTNVKIIPNAGHHIYSDNPIEFHQCVLDACGTLQSNFKLHKKN